MRDFNWLNHFKDSLLSLYNDVSLNWKIIDGEILRADL